jgi:hypothetical protein
MTRLICVDKHVSKENMDKLGNFKLVLIFYSKFTSIIVKYNL